MWRRAILTVGGLATLAVLAVVVLGYRLRGDEQDLLPTHALLAFGAFLLVLFVHLWLLLFLWASGRAARATVREHGLSGEVMHRLRAASRMAWPWVVVATLLVAGGLVTGGLAFTHAAPLWVHHAVAIGVVIVELWALWRANRALRLHDQLFAELARAIPAP